MPPPIPVPAADFPLVTVGSIVYLCGGRLSTGGGDGGLTKDCYTLDTSALNPEWKFLIHLPVKMTHHTAVAIGSKIWFVYESKLHELDTTKNRFKTFILPFSVMSHHCAVSNKTHSYIVGGSAYDEIWVNVDASSPARWKKVARLDKTRMCLDCLWFKNEIFIAGGCHKLYEDIDTSTIMNVETHQIRNSGKLVRSRCWARMFVADGKPAIVGGMYQDGSKNVLINSVETYSASKGTWEIHGYLHKARSVFGLAQLYE